MTKIDTSAEAVERLRDERLTATGPALEAWSLLASLALGALAAERDRLAARVAELEAALRPIKRLSRGRPSSVIEAMGWIDAAIEARAALAGSARNDG